MKAIPYIKHYAVLLLLPLLSLGIASCATNPVTGQSNLIFMSTEREIALGNEHYLPSQQSQGGEFVIDPELTEYVNTVGQRVAAVSDNPLPYEFVVLNNSVPNAWALPGGKIAINRGLLLEFENEAELAAVLGHEVVHAAARHGAQAVSRGTLLQGAVLVGAVASRGNEYAPYLVGASAVGAQLISQRYGRDAEREADYYGTLYMTRAGYHPQAAVSLQQAFVRLSEGREPGWMEGLFSSHPPSQERVRNNQELVDELLPTLDVASLEFGEERYQRATAFLRETAEAYELFDEAHQAANNQDFDQALNNLDRAIAMVPNEARFQGLKADIYLYQRRYNEAIPLYSDAISHNANYFDYYLGRGIAYSRQGDRTRARQDLERSAELLPTSVAMNELGRISLAANQRDQARQYFQMAASGGGDAGQEAERSFVLLDIEDNPGNYIQAQLFTDNNGRVFARLSNRSNVDVSNVVVEFAIQPGSRVERQQRQIQSLRAGQAVDVNSGLAFPAGVQPTANQMQARVLSARVQ